jgi:hypothetical protein
MGWSISVSSTVVLQAVRNRISSADRIILWFLVMRSSVTQGQVKSESSELRGPDPFSGRRLKKDLRTPISPTEISASALVFDTRY